MLGLVGFKIVGDLPKFDLKGFEGASDLAGTPNEVHPSELGTPIDFVNAIVMPTSSGGEAVRYPKFFEWIEKFSPVADVNEMYEAKRQLIAEINSVRVQLVDYLSPVRVQPVDYSETFARDLETVLKSALDKIQFANERVRCLDDEIYFESAEYSSKAMNDEVDFVSERVKKDIEPQIKELCKNPDALKTLENWAHHPLKHPFGQIVKPNDASFNQALLDTALAIMNGDLSGGGSQNDAFSHNSRHSYYFYQSLYCQLNEKQQRRLRMLISDTVLIWQLVGHLSSDDSTGSPAVWLTKNAQLPRRWEGSNKNKLWKEQNARDRIDQLIETWKLLYGSLGCLRWVVTSSELRGFVPFQVLIESIDGFLQGTWSGKAGRNEPKLREVKNWRCTSCDTEFENGNKLHNSPLPREDQEDLVVRNELPSRASEFARAMCANTVDSHQCWEEGGVLVPNFRE